MRVRDPHKVVLHQQLPEAAELVRGSGRLPNDHAIGIPTCTTNYTRAGNTGKMLKPPIRDSPNNRASLGLPSHSGGQLGREKLPLREASLPEGPPGRGREGPGLAGRAGVPQCVAA